MSYEKPRISLRDTMPGVLAQMAGGNPGALTVLMKIVKDSPAIDPQGVMGGLGAVLGLDTEDIYEERIWMFYKDLCKQNMVKMLACLRGSQLGFITTAQLNQAIDGKGDLDVDELLAKVKVRLTQFDNSTEQAEVATEITHK